MPWITKDGRRIFVGDNGPQALGHGGPVQRPTGNPVGNSKVSAEAINKTRETTSASRAAEASGPQSKAYHLGFAAHHEQEASSREKLMQNPNLSSSTYDRLAAEADSHRLAANAHHEAAASFGTEGARVSHPDHLSQSGTPHTGMQSGAPTVGGRRMHYDGEDRSAVLNIPKVHKELMAQGYQHTGDEYDATLKSTIKSYSHPDGSQVTIDHKGDGKSTHQSHISYDPS